MTVALETGTKRLDASLEPIAVPPKYSAEITSIKFAYSLKGSSYYHKSDVMVSDAWRHRIAVYMRNTCDVNFTVNIKATVIRPDNSKVVCSGSLTLLYEAVYPEGIWIDPPFRSFTLGLYQISVEISAEGIVLDTRTFEYTT